MSDYNRAIIEEFRANEGRVGGNFEGRTLLLLHHTGAKSGNAYINPLGYQRLSDDSVAVYRDGEPYAPPYTPKGTDAALRTYIAGDAQVAPSTVREHYQLLEDTLVGFFLLPWIKSKRRKAIATAKFHITGTGSAPGL